MIRLNWTFRSELHRKIIPDHAYRETVTEIISFLLELQQIYGEDLLSAKMTIPLLPERSKP
jgi:hypothetical protein